MWNQEMNRRTASGVLLSAAALASVLKLPGAEGAPAQPAVPKKEKNKDQQPAGTSDFEKLVRPGKTHDWTLKVVVNVSAFVQRDGNGMPVIHDFDLTSAAVVFPVLKKTASHKVYIQEVDGTLKFNDVVRDRFDGASASDRDQRLESKYPCGTRLAKWLLKNEHGREVELEVNIPCTCWQTIFDEKKAEKVVWPAAWPMVPASTFNDLQNVGHDKRGTPVPLIDHGNPELRTLVNGWCENKDPKTVKPVPLAKFLAGKVLEYVQPNGDGLNFNDNGLLEGLALQGSTETVRTKRGTQHDIACVLAAVYRSVGLPARIVVGYDVSDSKGDGKSFLSKRRDGVPDLRSWVEFCLYDETEKKEVWVPVDVNRQRKVSSRLTSPSAWRYFGNHDELDLVIPIAFQYHPPTSVIAHGSVAFWGWQTLPEAQVARQFLRFSSQTTAKTASTRREREQAEEEEEKKSAP